MVNLTLIKKIQKKKKFIVATFFFVLLAISFSPNISLAFSDAIINFDGIGEIAISAIQNNVDSGTVTNTSSGGGRSAQRSTFTLFIQIPIDEKFPQLFLKAANGAHIKEATINFEEDLYSINLSDVIIASLEFSDLHGQDAMFSIGLSFGKIEWTYDGVTTGWDLQANKPVLLP